MFQTIHLNPSKFVIYQDKYIGKLITTKLYQYYILKLIFLQ